jgi:hypothetical protein
LTVRKNKATPPQVSQWVNINIFSNEDGTCSIHELKAYDNPGEWFTLVILATQEVEIGKNHGTRGYPGEEVGETLSQQTSQAWWCISVIPSTQKV